MSFERGPPRTDLTILSGVLVLIAELENPQTFSGIGTHFRVDPTFERISLHRPFFGGGLSFN
jgi:hypothetical protein